MTGKLPSSASVATSDGDGRLYAPAAARNVGALCDLLHAWAPSEGQALEIASGTGEHVAAFARSLPRIAWQPTDVAPDRLTSIDLHVQAAKVENVHPAQFLDATKSHWHARHSSKQLIVLINLLHLVSATAATTIVSEAIATLSTRGRFVLYGPFKRDGQLVSEGDKKFDAQLRAADPKIGYKDTADVERWLRDAGASQIDRVEMPANNLAFVASR